MRKRIGPTGFAEISWMLRVIKNYPEAYLALHREFGDVAHIRLPFNAYIFGTPEAAIHILKTNAKNYIKGSLYDPFRSILGEQSLVTGEGAVWTQHRRLIGPEFRPSTIGSFDPVIARCTENLIQRWRGTPPGKFDLAKSMMQLTFEVISEALFGASQARGFGHIGDNMLTCLEDSTADVFVPIRKYIKSPAKMRAKKALQEIDDYVLRIIQLKRDEGASDGTLLARMIRATDDQTKYKMNDAMLKDEVKTLILAGHETTSLALTWCFYLLGRHPQVMSKLKTHIRSQIGDEPPNQALVEKLPYVTAVLQEAMRLYPPIPSVARTAIGDDDVAGLKILAGQKVVVAPYVLQRSGKLWSHPDKFDPDRFYKGGQLVDVKPGTYLPFLMGPRACVGESFARLEATMILTRLLQCFSFKINSKHKIASHPVAALRLAEPLMARVKPIPVSPFKKRKPAQFRGDKASKKLSDSSSPKGKPEPSL